MSESEKDFHPSTLKLTPENKRLSPNDSKREQNRYAINLHVNHTREELSRMVIPRGMHLKIHAYDINERMQSEGLLITIFGNDITPNVLERRDLSDLQVFANEKLKIIRDNPYELKGIVSKKYNTIRAPVTNEELAKKAFNMYKVDDNEQVYGEL